MLVLAACAVALVGCAPEFDHYAMRTASSAVAPRNASAKPKIPLPDRALLEPQAEPDCGSAPVQRAAGRSTATAAMTTPALAEGGGNDPNAELALRIRLEYERECYRQAEIRVRDRLKQLQMSTTQTMRTIDRAR